MGIEDPGLGGADRPVRRVPAAARRRAARRRSPRRPGATALRGVGTGPRLASFASSAGSGIAGNADIAPGRSRCQATPVAAGRGRRHSVTPRSQCGRRRRPRRTGAGERHEVLDGVAAPAARSPNLDLVAAQRAERGHPAEARRRHRPGAGRQVAQRDGRVQAAQLADQPGRRPGVETVLVGDGEDSDDASARSPSDAASTCLVGRRRGARPCPSTRRAPRRPPRAGRAPRRRRRRRRRAPRRSAPARAAPGRDRRVRQAGRGRVRRSARRCRGPSARRRRPGRPPARSPP